MCVETRFDLKIPSFHKWESAADSRLEQLGPDGELTNSTKQVSGSDLLETFILLKDGTPASKWVSFGK